MGNKRRVWPKIERHNFAVRFFERDVANPLLSEGLLEKVLSVQANKEGKGRSGSKNHQQRKKTTVSVSVAAIDAVRPDLAFLPDSRSKQSRIQCRSWFELTLTLYVVTWVLQALRENTSSKQGAARLPYWVKLDNKARNLIAAVRLCPFSQ